MVLPQETIRQLPETQNRINRQGCTICGKRFSPTEALVVFHEFPLCASCICHAANQLIYLGKCQIVMPGDQVGLWPYEQLRVFAFPPDQDFDKIFLATKSSLHGVSVEHAVYEKIKKQAARVSRKLLSKVKALKSIKMKIKAWKAKATELYQAPIICKCEMPAVPPPNVLYFGQAEFAPPASGIYFFWNDCRVVYVGLSENLRKRLTPSHHQIQQGDWVSWVECAMPDLNAWEAYYMWKCRPRRNASGRFAEIENESTKEALAS